MINVIIVYLSVTCWKNELRFSQGKHTIALCGSYFVLQLFEIPVLVTLASIMAHASLQVQQNLFVCVKKASLAPTVVKWVSIPVWGILTEIGAGYITIPRVHVCSVIDRRVFVCSNIDWMTLYIILHISWISLNCSLLCNAYWYNGICLRKYYSLLFNWTKIVVHNFIYNWHTIA